jgi:hypothetical protein
MGDFKFTQKPTVKDISSESIGGKSFAASGLELSEEGDADVIELDVDVAISLMVPLLPVENASLIGMLTSFIVLSGTSSLNLEVIGRYRE